MSNLLALKEVLPNTLKKFITPEFEQEIAELESDALVREHIEKNMISYSGVLKGGEYTLESYLHAIAYTTHRLTGDSNVIAFAKAFPKRYAGLVASGATSTTIKKYAKYYENSKLVAAIMEQSIVPTWILNQDIYQKAINTQAELMMTANSEKVRCDAANSLLTHLARPKEVAPLVNVNINTVSELDLLKQAMVDLAQNQQSRVIAGTPTKNIANEDIINGS